MGILATAAVIAGAVSVTLLVLAYLRSRAANQYRQQVRERLRALWRRNGRPASQGQATRARAPDLIPLVKTLRARHERQALQESYALDFPPMLEILGLGMRAGLGFDQAFALYARRFDTPLARLCLEHLEVWECGLVTREAGLRELASKIASPFFTRFTTAVLRAVRYGSPMTQLLAGLAEEARKEYRSQREERIAKAPVKMLIPTGALILPAMLMLVMGPIGLDLMQRMV